MNWNRWRWTFRLPFRGRKWLSIQLDPPYVMPPAWRVIANDMFCGRRPAEPEFLAMAWLHEQMHSHKMERERCIEIALLQRKLTAQKAELRRFHERFAPTVPCSKE